MGDETRHFVGYHNTEGMGHTLSEGAPFRVLSNKSLARLQEGVVWLVVGEGKKPRRYSLGSVFRVDETGDTGVDGFKHFAAGRGHLFEPPVALNDLDWFDDFRRSMNSFQFGVQPLKRDEHVRALSALAAEAGASIP